MSDIISTSDRCTEVSAEGSTGSRCSGSRRRSSGRMSALGEATRKLSLTHRRGSAEERQQLALAEGGNSGRVEEALEMAEPANTGQVVFYGLHGEEVREGAIEPPPATPRGGADLASPENSIQEGSIKEFSGNRPVTYSDTMHQCAGWI